LGNLADDWMENNVNMFANIVPLHRE